MTGAWISGFPLPADKGPPERMGGSLRAVIDFYLWL
jgi:hypothetical protein